MATKKKVQTQKSNQVVHHRNGPLGIFSDWVSAFTGSWTFIVLHLIWFVIWFLCSLEVEHLTLILSVEAIFLATFILMTQKRQQIRDTRREERDLATDLKAEREIQVMKKLLDKIHKELRSRK